MEIVQPNTMVDEELRLGAGQIPVICSLEGQIGSWQVIYQRKANSVRSQVMQCEPLF